jgi:hypothetical protein
MDASGANNCITTQTSTTAQTLAHKPKLTQVIDDSGAINNITSLDLKSGLEY